MSKLYTEEQMIQAYELGRGLTHEEVIEQFVPIQLPTDEEVINNAYGYVVSKWEYAQDENIESFIVGANWMRDKIKGGGNE